MTCYSIPNNQNFKNFVIELWKWKERKHCCKEAGNEIANEKVILPRWRETYFTFFRLWSGLLIDEFTFEIFEGATFRYSIFMSHYQEKSQDRFIDGSSWKLMQRFNGWSFVTFDKKKLSLTFTQLSQVDKMSVASYRTRELFCSRANIRENVSYYFLFEIVKLSL